MREKREKTPGEKRAARWGYAIAAAVLLLLALLSARAWSALFGGGLRALSDLGDTPMITDEYAIDPDERPTRPPLEEETAPDDPAREEAPEEATADVPVEASPEQLAESAPDRTPPPDAPVG